MISNISEVFLLAASKTSAYISAVTLISECPRCSETTFIATPAFNNNISMELDEKRSELQWVNQELASAIEKAENAAELLDRIKNFVSSFGLFAPTIEEYANQVEADKTIEAGNSFRGILN